MAYISLRVWDPRLLLPRLAVAQLEAQDKPLCRLGHGINAAFVAGGAILSFALHCIIRGLIGSLRGQGWPGGYLEAKGGRESRIRGDPLLP